MAQCLTKTPEYYTKLALSGIPEYLFHATAGYYLDTYGRYPYLDELPNSDSSLYIIDTLHIKRDNSTSIDNILSTTGTSSVQAATILLNDTYRDLEIDIFPMKKEAIINITKRPSRYAPKKDAPVLNLDIYPNTAVVFNDIFTKLRNLYGIELIPITDKTLATNAWKDIPDVLNSAAFVFNGKIYINTDKADIDAPIHEMTHILLGSIRFTNPLLYMELVSMADKFEQFLEMAMNFPNKTLTDIQEEIFVLEVSKHLAGLDSALDLFPPKLLYELHYNIQRLIDSALMGNYSAQSVDAKDLYLMSLNDLAVTLESTITQPMTLSSLDDAALHRMLANEKTELIKKGYLREEC